MIFNTISNQLFCANEISIHLCLNLVLYDYLFE